MPKATGASTDRAAGGRREEGAGKVLVVDDDIEVRSTLADHLAAQGYTVLTAVDAEQALETVRTECPDLILLDLLLPGLDGLRVLRRVRHADPTVCVVVMTGLEDDGLAASTIRLGASHCLRKPFGLDRLDRAVRSSVGLRRKSGGAAKA
jgi:DNA-binding response OmpR family regulator